MTSLVLLLVLAEPRFDQSPPPPSSPPPDPDALLPTFEKECKSDPTTLRCRTLRSQIEAVYLEDLVQLRQSGQPVDPKFYRAAAMAQSPLLNAIGLRALAASRGISAADKKAVEQAVDSPYPAVRSMALHTLQVIDSSNARRFVSRRYQGEENLAEASTDWLRRTRDTVPDAKALGVPTYPGARYRFLASGPNRAFFTTADPAEKVVAFYAKGGKKAYSASDLRAVASGMPDQQTMMELAQKDPKKLAQMMEMMKKNAEKQVQEAMRRTQAGEAQPQQPATVDWTRGIEGAPGVSGARYVVMETKDNTPTRVVVVFKDELLGATAIVVPLAAAK